MKPIIIFPCLYGRLNEVDPDYKFEFDIANKYGMTTITFNYDDFISGSKLKLSNIKDIEKNCGAIYRGWMLKPTQYFRLYNELKNIGINLLTNIDEYMNTHCFINSYNNIVDYTPKTIWFAEGNTIDWQRVRNSFDKFIVKDFVKSVKGFEFPEYLESSMTDYELNNYINKFKQLRGDLYTGGIVLKEYIELDKSNGHTHEFRAFYINKQIVTIYSSEYDEDVPEKVKKLASEKNLRYLHSPFYTIDFALLNNDSYKVIEIGDGQVSGIKSEKEAEELYKSISNIIV